MKQKNLKPKEKTSSEKMTTLSSCVDSTMDKGFTINFKIEGNLLWDGGHKYYEPQEVTIKNYYRFEGDSDPADNSILYLVATSDGKKGILIDAYGVYEDVCISEFIKKVTDIEKQKPATKHLPAVLYYTAGAIALSVLLLYKKLFHKKHKGIFSLHM